jgi:hypothetical protein
MLPLVTITALPVRPVPDLRRGDRVQLSVAGRAFRRAEGGTVMRDRERGENFVIVHWDGWGRAFHVLHRRYVELAGGKDGA